MEYTLTMRLKLKDTIFWGPGPSELLMLVDQGVSLNQAATQINMSYSKAWKIIKNAEKALGFPLLNCQRGGSGGGGSSLTKEGQCLLEKYQDFQKEMYCLGNELFAKHFGELI